MGRSLLQATSTCSTGGSSSHGGAAAWRSAPWGTHGCKGTACSTRGLSLGHRGTAAACLEHLLPPALPLGAAGLALTPLSPRMALFGAPAVVSALGFKAGSIAAGSAAAKMMSVAAIANNGGVAAGSTVAVLQWLGAAGLPVGAKIGLTSILTLLGAAVGASCL
uniref:Uncharacterized protein n=1 Tax=Anas zonorhyncha TaxID=75864 RepID=A0A8B9UDW2_9AVES